MKIKSQKDFFAGLMFMGIGTAFAWGATSYNIGTGARMGPGYFPLILGILLAVRLIPAPLMAEFRTAAVSRDKPVSRAGLAFIVLVWLVVGGALSYWLWTWV